MNGALAMPITATAPGVPSQSNHAAPELELTPFTEREIHVFFRGGEPAADDCEALLAWASRARGSLDLALGEGLDALRRGDRLACLGHHLDDYAREVLDLGKRTAEGLARLGRELRTRPLLREALRAGAVRLRAAETVLPVATGEAEATWVERAARLTVRELEYLVRREGAETSEDEPWLRLRTHLPPDERLVLDAGLELARELVPGASRMEALEALAQEFLAECPSDPDEDDGAGLRGAFRNVDTGDETRRAALEAEMEGWVAIPPVGVVPAPDVRFDDGATAQEVDARLRELATLRARWDDLVGYCAHVLKRSGIHLRLGFASFRHYCEERLQLPARTVEQRAALEKRLWGSPALREARRQRLSFEKLRLLATLPEEDIGAWTPRAHGLTCVALRRKLDGERERQMRAQRQLSVALPRRIAAVLAAALQAVRARVGALLPVGKALAILGWHFLETWSGAATGARSRARKVRDRDDGNCQVPGCSHRAAHAHHVEFRSHGGGDEPENQIAVCAFHHLRCIHGGHLRVEGRAPDALIWFLAGRQWAGA